MPTATLTNYSDFTGDIFGETGVVATTNLAETTLITGVTATKAADKEVWINGALTYTITLLNNSGEDYDNVVLTDNLDPLITLDTTYGVYLNGAVTTDYSFAGGLLTVNVGTIADTATAIVTFKVLQV